MSKKTEADDILEFIEDDYDLCKYLNTGGDLLSVVMNMSKVIKEQGLVIKKIRSALKSSSTSS